MAMDILHDVNEIYHRRASRCFARYKLDVRQELHGIIKGQVQQLITQNDLVSRNDLRRMVEEEIDKKMV